MNIALIGLRCAGKTTIGRLLAHELRSDFLDLDERTLAQFDEPTITAVWREHGEAAWRSTEARELRWALESKNVVIALGGGTPTIDEAQQLIEAHVKAGALCVVYLRCDSTVLAERRRATTDDDRPALGESIDDEIDRMLRTRGPIFEGLAQVTIETGTLTAREAMGQILAHVRSLE